MSTISDTTVVTQPFLCSTSTIRRGITIGLPKCSDSNELRFPLTPEGARMLVEAGFSVKMQTEASSTIHYSDAQYTRCGVEIVTRAEALRCDVVIHLSPLTVSEVHAMKRGAMLLCLLGDCDQPRDTIRALLERNIVTVALDLIEDSRGNTPFADLLSEIDGRAAIAIASSLLADAIHGKGILLGGVAGVVPCEVTIIGSGIAACSAARSAAGAGAMVRMFDNDVYSLRRAGRELGNSVIGSAIHPRVIASALCSADVVVATDLSSPVVVDAAMVAEMKKGVIIFDLSHGNHRIFPSLPVIDLASASAFACSDKGATRVAYINAGSAVPRTAAMALSNAFLTLFTEMTGYDGIANALRLVGGLQKATVTFFGRAVNMAVARKAGVRHVDISLFLTIS